MTKDLEVDVGVRKSLREWELWTGSYYELAIPFAIGSLTHALRSRMLQRIWHGPHVAGFVVERDDMGDPWLPVDEQTVHEEWREESLQFTRYGCIQLPEGQIVGCTSTFLENQYEAWFIVGIPMGMMETIYTIHYGEPDEADKVWTRPLNRRLAEIGAWLHAEVPFEQAKMGEEASATGELDEKYLVTMPGNGRVLVSEALFHRFGVPPHGVPLGHGLWWLAEDKASAR
jgi:hypothetical protein